MSQSEVPVGVGPHEGKELELLLAGTKPLAMFTDVVPATIDWGEASFEPHVDEGEIVKQETIIELAQHELTVRFVYYCLPDEQWRIKKLHDLNVGILKGTIPVTDETETETGKLLGYDEEDIKIFLDWTRQMQASHTTTKLQ